MTLYRKNFKLSIKKKGEKYELFKRKNKAR
jgi:hypothetical protein